MGIDIPSLVIPHSIRKQAEQVMKGKPVNFSSPCPLHQFMPSVFCPGWLPSLTTFENELLYGTVNEINPFLQLSLVMVFHHSNTDSKTWIHRLYVVHVILDRWITMFPYESFKILTIYYFIILNLHVYLSPSFS